MKVSLLFLLLALILPALVCSTQHQQHRNSRLLARRARASGARHQRLSSGHARLARYGRYAADDSQEEQQQQQQEQQQVDDEPQQQQQQQQHEDNEPEQLEQFDVSGGAAAAGDYSPAPPPPPVQQERLPTTKAAPITTSAPSYGSFTQAPNYGFETSTFRPTTTAQLKEDSLEQVRDHDEQQQQQQQTNDLGDAFGNFLPSDEQSYAGVGNRKSAATAGARRGQQQEQQEVFGDAQLAGMDAGNVVAGGGVGGGDGSGHEDEYGGNDADTTPMLRMNVRGEPGQDYPILGEVPETGFKCAQQQYPGYYADVEARCQVFHVCQDREQHQSSFLCPNGTIFSQQHFVCVWWFEFDCNTAPQLYDLNAQLYTEVEGQPQGGAGGGGGGGSGAAASGAIDAAGPYADKLMDSAAPKFSSPKENLLNKMYGGGAASAVGGAGQQQLQQQQQQQVDTSSEEIDDFGEKAPATTTAPAAGGYAPRGGAGGAKTRPAAKTAQTSRPNSYEAVTSSSINEASDADQTTPDSLEEALGEEIHSETPLIESLPLTTTLLPKISGSNGYRSSYAGSTPSTLIDNEAELAQPDKAKTDRLMNFYNQMSSGKINGYGVPMTKGNRASQMPALPDSPAKNGRGGQVSSKAKAPAYGGRTGKTSNAGGGLKW